MDISTKIKMAEACAGISEAELARRLGTTSQAFYQRLKTGKFSSADLEMIAGTLGATFEYHFVFPDGSKV